MEKCPICGKDGVDIVFKFYCSNHECQNYNKSEYEEGDEFKTDEICEIDEFDGYYTFGCFFKNIK